jgi:hypothetical protein
MKATVLIWRVLRVARWTLWLSVLAVFSYFVADREALFTPFGQLKPSVELFLFGIGAAPAIVGLFEMMMRDRAGVTRMPDRVGTLVIEKRQAQRSNSRPRQDPECEPEAGDPVTALA